MNGLKPKKKKKEIIDSTTIQTLDKNHDIKLQEFFENDTVHIPQLKKQKEMLLQKLKNDKVSFSEKMDIIDEIQTIKIKIMVLKTSKKSYFVNNSEYIFAYFEDKKNISKNIATEKPKSNILNKFFNIAEDISNNDVSDTNSGKETNYIEKYFSNVNNIIINMDNYVCDTDICPVCKKGEMVHVEEDGNLTCTKCYFFQPFLFESDKPSYKEPPKEVGFYAYQRFNHMKEILAQFQGKETMNMEIMTPIIEEIKLQIAKERLKKTEITIEKTREILKKLGYSNHYEHIIHINKILGIQPHIIPFEIEEQFLHIFCETQEPYAKCIPDTRTNYLNYHYAGYKIFEMMSKVQYKPAKNYLPIFRILMLKDEDKIIEQDAIWKSICKCKGWPFYVTV